MPTARNAHNQVVANGPRGGGGPSGGGWSDEPPEWMGLGAEGSQAPRSGRRGPPRQPGYDDGGWGRPTPRGRSAVHDPWGGRRGIGLSGLPIPPKWLGGVLIVLSAFLLGRCTAGGGDETAETITTTTTTLPIPTTVAIQATYTVRENDILAEIAGRYGVTIEAIASANPEVTDINNIFRGQVLKIPAIPTAATVPPATTPTTKKKGN